MSLHALAGGHSAPTWMVTWSPCGTRLASASEDGSAIVWSVPERKPLLRLDGHQDGVWSVTWSPDGSRLATGGNDGRAAIFHAARGRRERWLEGHGGPIWATGFSPDGTLVATGSADRTLRIWDAFGGACLCILEGHGGLVKDVRFSPDGRLLASACDDGVIRLYARRDPESRGDWSPIARLVGHAHNVNTVDWSPDGRTLVSCSHDRSVRVWDVSSAEETVRIPAHRDDIDAAALSPDGRTIASCGHDRAVRLWSCADGRELASIAGHADEVEWVSWDPTGSRLATACIDGRVRILDAKRHAVVWRSAGCNRAVSAVAAGPEGSVALVQGDRTLRILDRTRRVLATIPQVHEGACRALAWSRDGATLFTASLDGRLRRWRPGRAAPELDLELPAPAYALSPHPDGRTLALGLDDGSVCTLDVERRSVGALVSGAGAPIYAVAWSPDGRALAFAGREGQVHVRRGAQAVAGASHGDPVLCVAWSPDSSRLASGGRDTVGRVQGADGLLFELRGHRRTIWGIAFDPTSRWIATSSFDTTVRLWDAARGRELAVLEGHTREVSTLCWTGDGRLVTGSRDGTVRFWDPATGRADVVVPHEAGREAALRDPG
jgi:WD40 repeat protein